VAGRPDQPVGTFATPAWVFRSPRTSDWAAASFQQALLVAVPVFVGRVAVPAEEELPDCYGTFEAIGGHVIGVLIPDRQQQPRKGPTVQKLSLDALARELLSKATGNGTSDAASGSRAAQTVVGGHEKALRQTVIALAKGAALAEHASPGEATIYVLRGRVSLTVGADSWDGRDGDLLLIPDAPHSLTALADSAVLLTVVKRPLPHGDAEVGLLECLHVVDPVADHRHHVPAARSALTARTKAAVGHAEVACASPQRFGKSPARAMTAVSRCSRRGLAWSTSPAIPLIATRLFSLWTPRNASVTSPLHRVSARAGFSSVPPARATRRPGAGSTDTASQPQRC